MDMTRKDDPYEKSCPISNRGSEDLNKQVSCLGIDSSCSTESTDQEKNVYENDIGTSKPSSTKGKSNGSTRTSSQIEVNNSAKSSLGRGSVGSDMSDESICSSLSSTNEPHKGNDPRWDAIRAIRGKDGVLGLNHFRLLKRLGCGDIGSVYLAELAGGNKCYFAMKIIDKASLASRKKLPLAQTERATTQTRLQARATEIRQHPFFEGVNWALIRCASPPEIPRPVELELAMVVASSSNGKVITASNRTKGSSGSYLEFDFF